MARWTIMRGCWCRCWWEEPTGLQPWTNTWCERCGAFLSVPYGAPFVRCTLCQAETRVEQVQPSASPDSLPLQPPAMCGRCGMYLSVPLGVRSVCCPLCHAVTRVPRRSSGLEVFLKGLIYSLMYPPEPLHSSEEDWLPASYPRVPGSRKRALLIGICYTGTPYERKGSVEDVNSMSYLLRQRLGFPSDNILILTEEEKDPNRVPTMRNLGLAMRWLVQGCDTGDALSLFFYFSGHGFKEGLCAVDFEKGGVIPDCQINQTIVRPLGPGAKLHAVADTQHMGAVLLDLPYLCRMSRTGRWQWADTPKLGGGTNGGLAISISVCDRRNPFERPSYDEGFIKTPIPWKPSPFPQGNQVPSRTDSQNPAMYSGSVPTDNFIKAMEHQPGIGRSIRTMHLETVTPQVIIPKPSIGLTKALVESVEPGITYVGLLHTILATTLREPQLHASETFDIYRKPFLL